MDEEDIAELAGEKKLVTTEEFDIFGGTERELARKRQMLEATNQGGDSSLNLITPTLVSSLVTPSKDPVGIRLLRAMGWRSGQGIGARVLGRKRKPTDVNDAEDLDDVYAADKLFAPKDSAIISFTNKTDVYGIGYDPYRDAPEVAEMKRLKEAKRADEGEDEMDYSEGVESKKEKGKGSKGRGGFGVGVLEDDLDDLQDDDDIYSGGSSSKGLYHTMLFDEEDEDGAITFGGRSKKWDERASKRRKMASERDRDQEKHGRDKKGSGKVCSDGMPPLKGFVLVKKPIQVEKWYPPPVVPSSFIPVHIFPHPAHPSDNNLAVNKDTFASAADHRGHLLGETPLPGPNRSVFDYMPTKQKDKLDEFLGDFIIDSKGDKHAAKQVIFDIPKIDKPVALAALRGFMPFGDNLKKQARYRTYLEGQAGLDVDQADIDIQLKVPEGMTLYEVQKELEEFARAAQIFRPMSNMMASRFTSATTTTLEGGAESTKPGGGGLRAGTVGEATKARVPKGIEPEKSPAAQAAAMNMFGTLTRTTTEFYPNHMLCKRFNVADPHPDHKPSAEDKAGQQAGRTAAGSRDVLSKDTVARMIREHGGEQIIAGTAGTAGTMARVLPGVTPPPSMRGEGSSDISGVTKGEDGEREEEEKKDEEEKEIEFERPSMDIFKAIFADSDEDDEEEEKEKEKEKVEHEIAEFVQVRRSSLKSIHSDDLELMVGPAPPPSMTSPDSTLAFRPIFSRPKDHESNDEDEDSEAAKSVKSRPRKKSTSIKNGEVRAPAFGPVSFPSHFEDEDEVGEKNGSDSEGSSEGKHRGKHSKKEKGKEKEKEKKRHRDRDHDYESRKHKNHSSKKSRKDDSRDEDRRKRHHRRKNEDSESEGSDRTRTKRSEKARDEDMSSKKKKRRGSGEGEEDQMVAHVWVEKTIVTPSATSAVAESVNGKGVIRNRPKATDLW
ncbi:hypothetical protein BC937DRAFT_93726 [Endogone sp. FLAS-F59071]|nr:hypothetical protein BC937DRAFT_93726 [Endogone sp. FLAS-F59071]|eukprot:RUS21076.1 hypothetical protein BC937DRAFT_93726 [Endogone sp. FLAS-F59071]